MRPIRIAGVAAFWALAVTASAWAGDEPASKPGPTPAALDATFQQINQQVLDTYVGTLPSTWSTWPQRFNSKLDVNGNLCVAVNVMLSSIPDNRLRLLSIEDVENSKCRPESGYVGLGVLFEFKLTMEKGFSIEKVLDWTPAKAANLRSGTTIVAIDGVRLAGSDLIDSLELLLAKEGEVKLTVLDGEKETEVALNRKGGKLGFEFDYGKTAMTVTVGKVFPNSPAAKAGMVVGDVVTKLNNYAVVDSDPERFTGTVKGRLGEELGLTVVRDGKEVNLSIKRGIAVNEELAFGYTQVDSALRLTNLDWVKLTAAVDQWAGQFNHLHDTLTVDLRGASGEDPELAARLATRFIQTMDGDLLCYSEKLNGKEKTTRYFLAQKDGKSTLISESGGVETVIEQSPHAITGKLVVLVDEFTSGTAEALASALQRSGRATISGTGTANRHDLTVTKTFTSGDAQIVIELPAKRLVPGAGYKTLTIKPDQRKASTSDAGLGLLVLGVLVWLSLSVSLLRRIPKGTTALVVEHGSAYGWTVKRIAKVVLVLVALAAGAWCIYFGIGAMSEPKTEVKKASAYLTNILRTDEDSRINRLRYANADRGKLDVELKWGEDHPPVSDAEIETACRIAEAIAEDDFDKVKEIIVSYAHKPYARAQIAMSLNHAFGKAGVDLYIMFYAGTFMIERRGLDDGQVYVSFTPLEAPTLTVMVTNPNHPTSFTSTENSAIFEVREAFATFRAPLVRAVQETRAKEAREKK